ncbi:MAG: preprotein translocase subunit SecE [Chlamydiales bacterium]|nr:preprotein translocase subunit SecE [Chlamydiales bacterium]
MIDTEFQETTVKSETTRSKIVSVVREFKEELKKVSWTTREELKFFTKIVLLTTFSFGLGIYVVDLVIKGSLQLVSRVAHLIFG